MEYIWGGIMVKNVKFHKKFIATSLVVAILGTGMVGYQMHKKSEYNRVKGYLEDYLTEDNYVDLTRVSIDYDIEPFDGKTLRLVLEDSDIYYVRITDSYIYDGAHVTPFPHVDLVDYSTILGIDDNGEEVYKSLEPVRVPGENGVQIVGVDGYEERTIYDMVDPIRYESLDEKVVDVIKYPEFQNLVLKKK